MKKLFTTLAICAIGSIAFAQNRNIIEKSHLEFNNSGTSNIWGYVDGSGNEYALVGLTGVSPTGGGTSTTACAIVDVTNPTNPQLKFEVQGPNSTWREIRTWQTYAYITTEAGGGVTIVNLSTLPGSITTKQYTGDGAIAGQLDDIHALHIDNGKLYLYGGSLHGGAAKMFSLADPWNPVYLGTVTNTYVHDGFVKNDTLYAGEIFDGIVEIIDATDPQNPDVINSQETPSAFTHNTWLSTDGKTIYTTDEVPSAYVAAYDLSDMGNIKELDRYKIIGTNAVPHNTYVVNNMAVTGFNTDFLATSYYTEGVTLVDAARPANIVQVGKYDTNPLTGDAMSGAWGVYPYLPSGHLLISDMQRGLFVLEPDYQRAAYIEGVVKDSVTNATLANVVIRNFTIAIDDKSYIDGTFKVGTIDTGSFEIQFSKSGYVTKKVSFHLTSGNVLTPEVLLRPNTVGVSREESMIGLSVYPNPVNDESIISYDLNGIAMNDTKIELVDILGKKLQEFSVNQSKGQIQLNTDLEKGIYLIKMTNGDAIKTVKIIK